MAAATRSEDVDLTDGLSAAITAFLDPHVAARQEQLDQEQPFFTNLFLCPVTGGVLFEPSTMRSGVTVNRDVLAQAAIIAERDDASDRLFPFVHGLEAASSDVEHAKVNFMLRDVLLKVFPR
jgi:hypothetical protein